MSALDDLQDLVAPPPDSPPAPDWAAVERELGVRLPGDYRALVERYGAGDFGATVWVHGPAAPAGVELVDRARAWLDALQIEADEGEVMLARPHVGPDGLLPWGATDTGDVCLWHVHDPADPDGWTVLLKEARSDQWDVHDGGVVSFLVAWLSGAEPVPVLEGPPGALSFERF